MKLRQLLKEINFKGEMLLLKNTEKASNFGKTYGQNVEPAGFYCIQFTEFNKHLLKLPNYKLFKINLSNPLIIDITDDTLISWKRDLSLKYNAKKSTLTTKLKNDGFDAIITYNAQYKETGEIIILDTTKLKEIDKTEV